MFCFWQYFANSISRLLLPVDGAHAASCEEMATAMSSAEGAAYKGLQQCIETVMAEVCIDIWVYVILKYSNELFAISEILRFFPFLYNFFINRVSFLIQVERLLSAEQKATDYKSPDDGIVPDHRPTNACIRFHSSFPAAFYKWSYQFLILNFFVWQSCGISLPCAWGSVYRTWRS